MSSFHQIEQDTHENSTPAWGAVFVMSLCCAVLIASEFMPVSLLTPISSDLNMSEGQVGQAIAISGIFAVVASLTISRVFKTWDRRHIILLLTLLMIVSGIVITSAHSAALFMLGRAILGVVIGGFWAMSTSIVMRLVPPLSVPKALGLLNGGNALATTIAAPLGSFGFNYWLAWCFSVLFLSRLLHLFGNLKVCPLFQQYCQLRNLKIHLVY